MARTQYQKEMANQAAKILGTVAHYRAKNKGGGLRLTWLESWYEREFHKKHNHNILKRYERGSLICALNPNCLIKLALFCESHGITYRGFGPHPKPSRFNTKPSITIPPAPKKLW